MLHYKKRKILEFMYEFAIVVINKGNSGEKNRSKAFGLTFEQAGTIMILRQLTIIRRQETGLTKG